MNWICCISCNKQVRDGIYSSMFYPNLFTMLSAFAALTVVVFLFIGYQNSRFKRNSSSAGQGDVYSPVPLATAAIVLGIGLGGFIDGIVLHQLMQWHEMLSAKIPATAYVGKSVNMFWDGVFHFFCLIVVVIGVVLLWKVAKRTDVNKSGKLLLGGLFTGWAIFNLIEGIINHHLLKLHNVMEYAPDHLPANLFFLGGSLIMLLLGLWLTRRGRI
jgi:uncharacterized membrane protein